MKLIALDSGHGMDTPGKRTPKFPDGSFMHEKEFNKEVVRLLDINLRRCGFNTMLTAPGDADVPLKARTDSANKAKADLLLSIHANANTGSWGKWGGISSHILAKGGESEKVAVVLHKRLVGGTPLRDRGIEVNNFHMLRESKMPAVLFECAFMDNMNEAKLLMSAEYRQECADEIAQGVCEYYGVPYVWEVKPMNIDEAVKIVNQYFEYKGMSIDPALWTGTDTALKGKYADALIIKFAKYVNTKEVAK